MVKSSFVFFTNTKFHLPPPNSMLFGIMRIIIISKERTETQRTQVLGRKISWPWSSFHVSSPTFSLPPMPQEGGRLPAHWRQNLLEPLSARCRWPCCGNPPAAGTHKMTPRPGGTSLSLPRAAHPLLGWGQARKVKDMLKA